MSFLLGTKVKMSQIWKEDRAIPVTLVRVSPNTVSLVRKEDRDGYSAVQLRLGKKSREFKAKEEIALSEGDTVSVSSFSEGDLVSVSATSKGKGFQGVVKRHGFGGGPQTHGQKNRLRAPGSIGNTAPQRVLKGRKMAGRMGGERVTIKNLRVVSVDPEGQTLTLKGAVPGIPGTLLEIRTIGKRKKTEGKA